MCALVLQLKQTESRVDDILARATRKLATPELSCCTSLREGESFTSFGQPTSLIGCVGVKSPTCTSGSQCETFTVNTSNSNERPAVYTKKFPAVLLNWPNAKCRPQQAKQCMKPGGLLHNSCCCQRREQSCDISLVIDTARLLEACKVKRTQSEAARWSKGFRNFRNFVVRQLRPWSVHSAMAQSLLTPCGVSGGKAFVCSTPRLDARPHRPSQIFAAPGYTSQVQTSCAAGVAIDHSSW